MSDKAKAIIGNISVGLAVLAGVGAVIAGLSIDNLIVVLTGSGALASGLIGFIKSLFNRPA